MKVLENITKRHIRMKDYFLNCFKWLLTSATLKAFNGKVKRLLKNSYSLTDQEYILLRIRVLVDAKF